MLIVIKYILNLFNDRANINNNAWEVAKCHYGIVFGGIVFGH